MRQLILNIRPDALPGFDNYLPGANTEAVQAVAASAGFVYLWGPTGVGKTHLLRAWAAATGAPLHPAAPLPEAAPDALAVDDVESLDAAAQHRLFGLAIALREAGGRLLTAGAAPPASLAVRSDLATRLAQGLVFRLLPLSDADKALAITQRAESLGLVLPEEVTRHLLTHCRRDLPHLLETVDALDALSLSRKRAVTLPLLREWLQGPV
ncbi:MAG: DnaA regulatory inactivator Hda [Betaproteobacteria bacterium]|nr:DnaA regulatory inactivator Hda [Betaproteobacteria bacterium]